MNNKGGFEVEKKDEYQYDYLDDNILSKWHKSAAKATSFAEFEANMRQ